MIYWVLSVYIISIVGGGLWGWYLHKNGQLISNYPYDDEM
jgi:hypothetical protein